VEGTSGANGRLAEGKRQCFQSLLSYSFFSSNKTHNLAIDGPSDECRILRSGVSFSGAEAGRTFHRHETAIHEDGSQGQVLALLVVRCGLKDAPAAFLRALGDQMASFTYDAQHEPVKKEAQRRKK